MSSEAFLSPGRILLHYRLVELIGEGGMGQVWKALDTALERYVALKVLPVALAHDRDRLDRFDREARLLASLNHPNVAVVHGLHEAASVRFLAMELVAGEDLSVRLKRGPMPLAAALKTGPRWRRRSRQRTRAASSIAI
jgi:serine/threonine protein kinase